MSIPGGRSTNKVFDKTPASFYHRGMKYAVRTILDARAELAEGPFWDEEDQHLYWVNINAGEMHRCDPSPGTDTLVTAGQKVGAAVLDREGNFIAAGEKGFFRLSSEGGAPEEIASPETDNPDSRFNDGKCDPAGRFWAGTMSLSRTTGTAALYCLDEKGAVSRRVEGVTVSNGLAWDLKRSLMFYIDTPTKCVVAFSYNMENGEISSPRIAFSTPPELGSPDGMTIDDEGMLWIAFYRGACVARWNPESGEMLEQVGIPAPHVTSCCFGGKDRATLFVTTARQGMDPEGLEEYPEAGGIFAFEPGVSGASSYRYRG